MTALSICLGGKATSTDRAKSLKELIRRGSSRSTVSVKIHNTGMEAYKPDEYGSVIEIVRTFAIDGSQGYKLKSEMGRIISSKKEELLKILDRFQIVIDNPLAILSQDAARSFLTSSTPSSLYHFLSQGINHETMKKYLEKIDEHSLEASGGLSTLRDDIVNRQKEFHKLKKEFDERKEVNELAKKKGDLEVAIQWKLVELRENGVLAAEKEYQNIHKELVYAKEKVENFEGVRNQLLQDVSAAEELLNTARQAEEKQREDNMAIDKDYGALQNEKREIERSIAQIRSSIKNTEDSMRQIQGTIALEDKKIHGGYDSQRKQYLGQKEDLESNLQHVREELEKTEDHISTLDQQIDELSVEVQPLTREKQQLNDEIKETRSNITRTRNSESDFMQVFGDRMNRILALIDHNSKAFSKVPIGPVGRYVTLKDPKWAPILARQFRNTMNAFIVTNAQDREILQKIMAKIGYFTPIIVSRPDLYEFEHTMPDRHRYNVLYDSLDITDEYVKRVMIDHHKIESILLIPNRQEAERIIHNEKPKNASTSICLASATKGFIIGGGIEGSSSVTPVFGLRPPFLFRTQGEGQFEALEYELKELEKNVASINDHIRNIEKDLQVKKNERVQVTKDLGKLRKDRANIQRDLEIISENLSEELDLTRMDGLKEQLRTVEQELIDYRKQQQSALDEKANVETDITQSITFMTEANHQLKLYQDQTAQALGSYNQKRLEISQLDRDKDQLSKTLDKLVEHEAQQLKKVEELRIVAQEAEASALQSGSERMVINQSINDLTDHHKRLGLQLQAAEERYGDRSFDSISHEVVEKSKKLKAAFRQYRLVMETTGNIRSMHDDRSKRYEQLLAHTTRRIMHDFRNILKQRDFEGSLTIDHTKKSMSITCAPKTKGGASAQRDTRSLSGGEKSFSQIALLLAVWNVMSCNVRGLDEFDVFMDEVNRKVSMKLMISSITEMKNGQTIFITPNNMADINVNKNDVKIFRLSDPER